MRYSTLMYAILQAMINACGQSLDSVALNIESDMKAAICWYKNNDEIAANHEQFQLMFIGL